MATKFYRCPTCNGDGSPEKPYGLHCEAAWAHDQLYLAEPNAVQLEAEREAAKHPGVNRFMGPPPRTVLRVARDPHGRTMVFCSDGAVFILIEHREGKTRRYAWRPVPPIPDTPAEIYAAPPAEAPPAFPEVNAMIRLSGIVDRTLAALGMPDTEAGAHVLNVAHRASGFDQVVELLQEMGYPVGFLSRSASTPPPARP
jgi:hypothetical protein